ncbi:hypothetical protein [Bradyrhizobium sp. 18]|uniref:hypothetical protein n=1 Tax=Bradyrhizobium sp. 18 TaxID=2782657 RepID=UPI001FF9B1F5|nr:hypothetical protein [Bradyrhizobium sp. 18]MCK1507194.1 hypothetical protein [Bradyrhizobium sp. 18]
MIGRSLSALACAALLSGCYATASPPPVAEAPVPQLSADQLRELTPAEKATLSKGFAGGLKDPDSAKFQWTRVPKVLPADGMIDYCGLVNAKNSYGGYIGAQPFIGTIQVSKGKILTGAVGAVGDPTPMYREILPKMCRDKGLDPFAVSAS